MAVQVLPPVVLDWPQPSSQAPVSPGPAVAAAAPKAVNPSPVNSHGDVALFSAKAKRASHESAAANSKSRAPNKLNQFFIDGIVHVYRKITRETPVKNLWKYIRCSYAELGYDSCSEYGIQEFCKEPNTLKALYNVFMRVATCSPWTGKWTWATDRWGKA